jgi:membrane protein required for colicin V production
LNSLDVVILIIILIPALLSFRKGLIKSLVSLIAIVLGIYLATKFHSGFEVVLKKFISDEKWLGIISFTSIVVLIYGIGIFIAGKISRMNFITRTVDKIGGLALGLFKGLLIASILILFSNVTGFISEKDKKSSLTYGYVSHFAPGVYDFFKQNIFGSDKSFIDINDFLKKDSTSNKTK